MYAYIKGLLIEGSPLNVIIETAGIGYRINTPISLFPKLPALNEQILLHTSFVVRELSQTLYGFITPEERDLFEALQGVTGIGPKVALCIIGHTTIKGLYASISQHDILAISKIPGIGKKTAERLIIEMRDKLTSFFPKDASSEFTEFGIAMPIDPKTAQINDAMSALINLGYNQITAQKAIKKTLKECEPADLGALISAALQNIS